jgi:hypothetical protein
MDYTEPLRALHAVLVDFDLRDYLDDQNRLVVSGDGSRVERVEEEAPQRTSHRDEPTWVYFLLDPDYPPTMIFYVGISNRPKNRLRQHSEYPTGTTPHDKWIRNVLDRGKKPIMVVSDAPYSRDVAEMLEAAWIRYLVNADHPLMNTEHNPNYIELLAFIREIGGYPTNKQEMKRWTLIRRSPL